MNSGESRPLRVIHVGPSFGGIPDYSDAMLRVLAREYPAAEIVRVPVRPSEAPWSAGRQLARRIRSEPGLVLADLGSGDRAIFWALAHLGSERDVVLTIHDPGVLVQQLIELPWVADGPPVLHDLAFHLGKALNGIIAPPLFRRLLRRARARIVLNEAVHTLFDSELTAIPHPVLSSAPTPHPIPRRPCVAFAGFWGPTKGLDDLLEAYRALLPRFPDARFVIAGDGVSCSRWATEFRARARALGERVELPGFIPAEEFRSFLAAASVLVLPYREEVPGAASGILLRAQLAGVPIIVSRTRLLAHQVDDRHVTLVPPRDATALALAIADHLDRPEHHQERASREQARVYDRHGDREVGRRLRAILDPILGTDCRERR